MPHPHSAAQPSPVLLAGLAVLLAFGCAHPAPIPAVPAASAARCGAPVPEPLRPPAGHRLTLELAATGVQVYACQATPTGAAWTFKAPEAILHDLAGAPAGRHLAGPTWEATDGSAVVGAKVADASGGAGAIPWLLLSAKEHRGAGQMSGVTFVQRVSTSGGLAPSTGCATETLGTEARVPYTATYCFLAAE